MRLAISNPCFELWLALHHCDRTAFLNTTEAGAPKREHDPTASKHINPELYMPHRKTAASRARKLDAKHERDGTPFPHNNPSSGMHRFIEAIEPTGT